MRKNPFLYNPIRIISRIIITLCVAMEFEAVPPFHHQQYQHGVCVNIGNGADINVT
jgi:hypothetical protein